MAHTKGSMHGDSICSTKVIPKDYLYTFIINSSDLAKHHTSRINSNIRPPYVNGVVHLNDEAGHSSMRPPMFYHSKTLKLCYIIVWNLVFCILVRWLMSSKPLEKASKSFVKRLSRRQCFSEESNLHHVSPRRTTSSPLWRRNLTSCYQLFERRPRSPRNRKDVPTMRHRDVFQCQSKSKR